MPGLMYMRQKVRAYQNIQCFIVLTLAQYGASQPLKGARIAGCLHMFGTLLLNL